MKMNGIKVHRLSSLHFCDYLVFTFPFPECPETLLRKVCTDLLTPLFSAWMQAFDFTEISAECFPQRQSSKN